MRQLGEPTSPARRGDDRYLHVLVLTKYGQLGASSRVRFYQFLPALEAKGFRFDVAPLFSDRYVTGLQSGHRRLVDIVGAYVGRLGRTVLRYRFDLIWIEKELLPWFPAYLERVLLGHRVPYVLDYDDAVFHQYDLHESAAIRYLLGGKHTSLVRGAAMVIAGNEYLATYARAAGAPSVEVLPTVVDLARYTPRGPAGCRGEATAPTVGWIGQRATAHLLRPLAPLFERLAKDGVARFEAVGIDCNSLDLPMASVPWNEATEVASVCSFDIGIMPLAHAPFERGKCGYKLIQYMACGLPVVASPVGVNCQIVRHGVNGFLAETDEQWEKSLRTLLADPSLRRRMGAAGRESVEDHFCLQRAAPRLAELLTRTARSIP